MATESPPRPAAFAVSDVAPATQALPEVSPAEALSQLMRGSLLAVLERDGFGQRASGILERRKQAAAHRPDIEAVSDPGRRCWAMWGSIPSLRPCTSPSAITAPCVSPRRGLAPDLPGVANHINAAPRRRAPAW